ncbi:hypothetical protein Back11_01950 [Paenibacillus baekrokdamisoli]|uniref:Uncharacterized protein n=1 Tax=Paenibacillus baekrokdamisoli TaxID=1712516 RepID=A0A3G9IIP3_9BACL|nr:hypothetical protein [Paenibacillus baekrokdamisoli]MBB3069175.1 hypothetical protein [Paenibacillus baekrokdamisoli]BBH18850.1 hypothetical protein Back11_01950 [Paenibacillus baekrokdamisoli]
MKKYLFAYKVKSNEKSWESSVIAETEEKAREKIVAKIADFEFTDESEIELGELLAVKEANGNQYIECEGCSA